MTVSVCLACIRTVDGKIKATLPIAAVQNGNPVEIFFLQVRVRKDLSINRNPTWRAGLERSAHLSSSGH